MTDAPTIRPTRQFSEVEHAAGLADLYHLFLDEVESAKDPDLLVPWITSQLTEIVTSDAALPESANWYKMRFYEDALSYKENLGESPEIRSDPTVHHQEISQRESESPAPIRTSVEQTVRPEIITRPRGSTPRVSERHPVPAYALTSGHPDDPGEDPEVKRLARLAARYPSAIEHRERLVNVLADPPWEYIRQTSEAMADDLIREASSGPTRSSVNTDDSEPKRSLMSKLNPFPLMWRIFSKIGGWLIFHLLVFAAFAAIAGVYFYEADTDRQTICNDPDVGLDCYLASGEADWTGDTGKKAAIGGLVGVVFVIIGERVASRYKIIRKSTYEELRREPTL